ncbi:hypothetical protein [Fodinicola feengrottensis]|uniref:hypothetical protein n=1 Tax=Fodinicola feengrottensis TaxID=435914 RepID=UPI0013D66138|nr:hypothetical protein [Fodinicola feengrottensis]
MSTTLLGICSPEPTRPGSVIRRSARRRRLGVDVPPVDLVPPVVRAPVERGPPLVRAPEGGGFSMRMTCGSGSVSWSYSEPGVRSGPGSDAESDGVAIVVHQRHLLTSSDVQFITP